MTLRERHFSTGMGLLFAASLWSCSEKNAFVAPPPPEVDVQTPIVRTTTVYREFPGRTEAFARAEIRARVQGFLQAAEDGPFLFSPGQYVEKGTHLFTIEPDQYDAALKTAEADLAKANADLGIATTALEMRRNAKPGAVSQIDIETALAEEKRAQALLAIAEAAVTDAERNLAYTEVKTDMAGRVSRSLVDPGNLVGASEPTLLTTVVQDDPIYVNFEVSEREVLPFLKDRPNEEAPVVSDSEKKEHRPKLVFSNGEPYTGGDGMFDFVDTTVNPDTGTMKIRAIFENDQRMLADGLFVRVRVPEELPQAVLIPRLAIQRDLGGSYVLLVGPGNKVERRVVIPTSFNVAPTGSQAEAPTYRIIEPFNAEAGTGLKADDRVIVSNLQKARAGIVVKPTLQQEQTN